MPAGDESRRSPARSPDIADVRTRAWVTVTGVDSGAQVGQQGELFPAEALRDPLLEQGFRGPVVCQIVGISYRQLDYWARTHLVEPTLRAAAGSARLLRQ